jgi:putative transcriptional regulator
MENETKCPFCGNSNVETRTDQSYHFIESGLSDVYLSNVEISHCPDCKADSVSIPDATQVLSCLGEVIVLSPSLLTGSEVRFLRKNLHVKISDFAKLLGVDRVTLSRWENDQARLTKSADRLIRSIYLLKATTRDEVRDEFRKRLERDDTENHGPINLRLPLDHFSCVSLVFA